MDSLEAAGVDREELDEALETLREPQQGGGFQWRGGEGATPGSGRWIERPAEGRPATGRGDDVDTTLEQDILRLVRGDTGRSRWRRGGGTLFPARFDPAPDIEAGIYTVILKVGDRTYTQPLEILENPNGPKG